MPFSDSNAEYLLMYLMDLYNIPSEEYPSRHLPLYNPFNVSLNTQLKNRISQNFEMKSSSLLDIVMHMPVIPYIGD